MILRLKNQNGFAFIELLILLLLLAVLGFVGYRAYVAYQSQPVRETSVSHPSSKKEDTTKTYTNSALGFSFKYPNYFKSVDDKLPTGFPQAGSVNEVLRLSPSTTKFDPELQVYANPAFGGTYSPDLVYTVQKKGLGVTWTKAHQTSGRPASDTTKLLSASVDISTDKKLLFHFSYQGTYRDAYEKDFDDLITSLRFTQ